MLDRTDNSAGAMQWSDTASSLSTSIAYFIVVSVFLYTTAALRIAVSRDAHTSPATDRQSSRRESLLKSPPPPQHLPSSSALLLSRLSLQVRLPPIPSSSTR